MECARRRTNPDPSVETPGNIDKHDVSKEVVSMKRSKTLATALIMGALLVALSGCDVNEGPAEKAGKNVDEANQRAGERIEAAGERIEAAGEKIQDTAQGDD